LFRKNFQQQHSSFPPVLRYFILFERAIPSGILGRDVVDVVFIRVSPSSAVPCLHARVPPDILIGRQGALGDREQPDWQSSPDTPAVMSVPPPKIVFRRTQGRF
jgi:hypothetical protein